MYNGTSGESNSECRAKWRSTSEITPCPDDWCSRDSDVAYRISRIQSSFKLAKRKSISEVTPYVGAYCKVKCINTRGSSTWKSGLDTPANHNGPPLPHYYIAHPCQCRLCRCNDFETSWSRLQFDFSWGWMHRLLWWRLLRLRYPKLLQWYNDYYLDSHLRMD